MVNKTLSFSTTNGPMPVGKSNLLFTASIKTIMNAFKTDVIVGYEWNRGNGKTKKSMVHNLRDEMNLDALQAMHIADNGDGTYTLLDFHHRVEALFGEYEENKLSAKEADADIPIILAKKENSLKVYQDLNNQKAHTTRQKLINPDLGVGKLLDEILSIVSDPQQVVSEKLRHPVIYCVAAYFDNKNGKLSSVGYEDVGLNRRKVGLHANKSYEELPWKLTKNDKLWFSGKIAEVVQLINDYRTTYPNLSDGEEKLLRNTHFFGLLLWDKISNQNRFKFKSNSIFINKVHSHSTALLNASTDIHYKGASAIERVAKLLGK